MADKDVVTSRSAPPRSAVHEGTVCVVGRQDRGADVKCYLKAYCISADEPARLEAFENAKHANKGKPVLRVIEFSDVNSVSTDINKHQELIVIAVSSGDDFLFYVQSEDDHVKWLGYCNVLLTLQNCIIPEIPKRSLVSQECACRYTDPSKFGAASIFVVYLINEGVASTLGLSGLHIITIKESDSTFNIYAYHTEKHLVAWDQGTIRRSGCIGPLVFIESGRKCRGGPGPLWMYSPPSNNLREFLNNFLHPDQKKPIMSTPTESVSVDPDVNHTSRNSHQLLHNPTLPPTKPIGIQTSCDEHMQKSNSDNSQLPLYENHLHNEPVFRSRSEVISKSQGSIFRQSESYSKLKSKKLSHSIQPTQNATGSESTDTQKPPPLPPKPKPQMLSVDTMMTPPDKVVEFTSSESAVTSVYQRTQPLPPKSSHSLPSSLQAIPKKAKASDVLKQCAVTIISKLDIDIIIPHLLSHNLLTRKDHQFLLNKSQTDYDKVQYLILKLPKKAEGWFESFLECLRESEDGTGHLDIAKHLEEVKVQKDKELSSASNDGHLTVPVPVSNDTDESSFPVFIDSQSSDTVDTLYVLPSETVESLMAKVRKKFCISPSKPVKMKMMDFPLCRGKSVRESRISRYSYITVRVQKDEEQP